MKKSKMWGRFHGSVKKIFAFALTFLICTRFVYTGYAASAAITGKDGWLFFTGDDTINDYKGSDLFTMSQLQKLSQHLESFRAQLDMQGCEFVVFIAPNKEEVYSQYMPDSYGQPAQYTRAQQVADYLACSGFRVVYPLKELREAAETYPEYNFYYYGDTHWNGLGAYVGARALLHELGIDWPSIDELSIEPSVIAQGDLYEMLGRSGTDINYILTGYPSQNLLLADLTSNKSVARFYSDGADERKLMLVGDSFANALSGYLAPAFDQVVVSHDRSNYRPALLAEEQPDIYVYEVVERFLDVMNTDYGLFTVADLR